MKTVCAATPQQLARPLAAPRRSQGATSWRLGAFALPQEGPQGPFSTWLRQSDAAAAKAKQPPAPAKPAKKAAQQADELPSLEAPAGQPRFRSALEQVSYYTNNAAFNRESQ